MVYNEQPSQLEAVEAKQVSSYQLTLLATINDLVRSGGGQVVLYDLPISTISTEILSREVAPQERKTYTRELIQAGFTWIDATPCAYTDEDFPDAGHLRASRKSEFSAFVADSLGDQEQLLNKGGY